MKPASVVILLIVVALIAASVARNTGSDRRTVVVVTTTAEPAPSGPTNEECADPQSPYFLSCGAGPEMGGP